MKTWHIWDFPETVYFSFNDNFRKEFFDYLFNHLEGIRPAARFFGISQKTIKQYAQGYSKKNRIKHPQAIPICFLKKSINLLNESIMEKIEKNTSLIKAKNKGNCVRNPRLPFKESPAFYRIVAHMIGDGSAPGNKPPYYANTCKELREQFKEDLRIFGDMKVYDWKLTNAPVVYFTKVITDVLSGILDVRFSNPDRIPKQILNASDDCKSSFLQALFDDEGTISTSLALGMVNQNLVNEVRQLTKDLGVDVNSVSLVKNRNWRDFFVFSVKRDNFYNFRDKIGFSHPPKIRNLDLAIQTINREQRTRSKEEIEMQLIEKLQFGSFKTLDLANSVQLTLGHTLRHLKSLEEDNKVFRSGFKNKIIWSLSKA